MCNNNALNVSNLYTMKKFELILDNYGTGLSVKDGQFVIRTKESRQSLPVTKVRSICLSKSTSITGMAIKLALENEIDISFVERDNMPYARVWNSQFGSIATIRRNQLVFSGSVDGNEWIKIVIEQKIKNQMALVGYFAKNKSNSGPFVTEMQNKFSSYLLKIHESRTNDALDLANQLRGWEANASKLFFRCICSFLPKEFHFTKRSRRPALDPFNATLNYCYGILYNKIESMLIRSGLDPHIGIFHKDQYNRPVLVFDIIELFRQWAEYPVIQLFQNNILQMAHYSSSQYGVSILPPAKKIIIEVMFSYLNEKITYKNNRAKRIYHMHLYVQDFATKMKEYKHNEVKKSGI